MQFHLGIVLLFIYLFTDRINTLLIEQVQEFILKDTDNDSSVDQFLPLDDFTTGHAITSFDKNKIESESNWSTWPNGIVPYIIPKGEFSPTDYNKIMSAINDFHNFTCIRFKRRTTEKVYIRIESKKRKNSSLCSSHYGYTGIIYPVNLASPDCLANKGYILHELMHALGFIHEIGRNDRDKYVSIIWDNIRNGKEYNFFKFRNKNINNFGVPYDFESVMHYRKMAFSKDDMTRPTIIDKRNQGIKYGQRNGFSKGDIEKLNRMYHCNKKNDNHKISIKPTYKNQVKESNQDSKKPTYKNQVKESNQDSKKPTYKNQVKESNPDSKKPTYKNGAKESDLNPIKSQYSKGNTNIYIPQQPYNYRRFICYGQYCYDVPTYQYNY